MNLAFTDTETTGTEEEDRLLQLGYRCGGKDVNALFKPPLPIKLMAMATHHITEEMVADKPPFKGSPEHKFLKKHAKKSMVFVAHNADFDLKMMAKEGIEYRGSICTLKVVRHLDVEAKLECYKLQYLRYLFGIKVAAVAHDAWGDILVLEQLFWKLVKKIQKDEKCDKAHAIAIMMDISTRPSVIRKISFGKHKGKLLVDILEEDRGYLEWLLKEKQKANDPDDEDMIYTLTELLD